MKNNKKQFRVGIIGAGNIGNKRALAITELGRDIVTGVFDVNLENARKIATNTNVKIFSTWQEMIKDPLIDVIIVATPTDVNVKIVAEALKNGKDVLAEKPLGKSSHEAKKIFGLTKKYKRVLKVGFNHRHHPALFKAYELVKSGAIGKVFYLRAVYGHGARPGYDTEWRMQKKYSVGGELFDQGVHVIDLANWFIGGFTKAFGITRNYYWKKSNLEDNAFCELTNKKGQVATFHSSLTQWKNKFSFEIFGSLGYLVINGLGKSYGKETLVLGTEVGFGKVPKEQIFDFEEKDISWREEWKEFRNSILEKREPLANAKENLEVNKILEALYRSARSGKIIQIK